MHIILENLCDSLHTCNHLIRVMLTYKYIKNRRVFRDAVLSRVRTVGYLGVRLRPSYWYRRGKPDCYMFTTSNVFVTVHFSPVVSCGDKLILVKIIALLGCYTALIGS